MVKKAKVASPMFWKPLSFCLLFFSLLGHAQEVLLHYKSQYNQTQPHTVARFDVAGSYVQALFFNKQQDEAYAILQENIESASQNTDGKYAAYLYAILAMNNRIDENTVASKDNLKKAIYYSEKTSDNSAKGYVKYAEGWIESRNQQDTKAVEKYLEALKYYDQSPASTTLYSRLTSVYSELTGIYAKADAYELQEKYSKLTLDAALNQNDPNSIFQAYMSRGFMYELKLNHHPEDLEARNLAEHYYLNAITIFKSNQNKMLSPSDLSYVAINLANLYIQFFPQNYRDQAMMYAKLANKVGKETKQNVHIASSYGLLSELALAEQDLVSAKTYLLASLKEITENTMTDQHIRLSIYSSLAEISEAEQDYNQALEYYKLYTTTYKAVYDKEQASNAKRLEAQFDKERQQQLVIRMQLEAEKKEQQIQLMNSLGIQQKQEIANIKLRGDFQRKQLELSRLESDAHLQELTISQQSLKFSKLENKNRKDELMSYMAELHFKTQLNQYYIASIVCFVVVLILLLYALKQRNKRLKQRENLYNLELEQERQKSKISTLTALLDGQEQERARLARDLHDGLGSSLSGTKIQLTHLNEKVDAHAQKDLAKSINQLDEAVDELRRVAHNLMPDLLLKYGLQEALNEYATRMSHAYLDIDVQFLSYTGALDQEKQLLVYRIIQELVNNAVKHAEASQIIIQLVEDETSFTITVEDDGKGFDVDASQQNQSAGLHNIQSRIDFLKGVLHLQSELNLGTSIEFQFPKL